MVIRRNPALMPGLRVAQVRVRGNGMRSSDHGATSAPGLPYRRRRDFRGMDSGSGAQTMMVVLWQGTKTQIAALLIKEGIGMRGA